MKNVTNNRRTRVTRLLIRRAFTELLRKKPIQDISVKELDVYKRQCGGFHIGSTTLLLFLLHLYAAKGHAMRFFTDMPPAAENRARSSADGSNVRR